MALSRKKRSDVYVFLVFRAVAIYHQIAGEHITIITLTSLNHPDEVMRKRTTLSFSIIYHRIAIK